MAGNAIKAITLLEFDTNGLTGNYDIVTTDLENQCSILRFINDSNRDVTISYDGVNAHDYLRAGNDYNINAQTNSLLPGKIAMFQKGQAIYIMGTAGGAGYLYIAGYYS